MTRLHFTSELQSVRNQLIEMGETTASLLDEAVQTVLAPNPDRSERASQLEAQTDHQHRIIHDQCLKLITLQAPVAGDARLITGILDAIVDLELIGDYAYEIVTLTDSMDKRPPSQLMTQIAEIGAKVSDVLSSVIDSWRKQDRDLALSLRAREGPIRGECEVLYRKLSQLAAAPGDGSAYVDLMLVCKHLERIVRHAIYVADEAADAAPGS